VDGPSSRYTAQSTLSHPISSQTSKRSYPRIHDKLQWPPNSLPPAPPKPARSSHSNISRALKSWSVGIIVMAYKISNDICWNITATRGQLVTR
jgi:hypothetical protein